MVVAASTLESARLLLLSKSRAASERHRQLERPRRPQLLRARDGPERHRPRQGPHRQAARRSTTAGPAGSTCRASATSPTSSRTSSAATASRAKRGSRMFPDNAHDTPGFGAAYKKTVRDYAGAFINMGGFGEVLPRYENQRRARSRRQGQVGHPGAAVQLQVRRQREEDVRGHGERGAGDVRGGRLRDRQRRSTACSPRAGRSTSSAPRAWAAIPKTSVLNQFQQSHDVKNLFVVDGSSHVSASCQNPTWTIMALAWRSCDYLVSEFERGTCDATT